MALAQRNFDPIARAKSQLSNGNRGWSQKARESALSRLAKLVYPATEMNIGSIQIQLNCYRKFECVVSGKFRTRQCIFRNRVLKLFSAMVF